MKSNVALLNKSRNTRAWLKNSSTTELSPLFEFVLGSRLLALDRENISCAVTLCSKLPNLVEANYTENREPIITVLYTHL